MGVVYLCYEDNIDDEKTILEKYVEYRQNI